ncbi:hypothetical protein AA18889_2491 [Acetobacter senegalensis DSM 18889]|nr:hypothetical protein AA18889_2491 [Acetobacter senegalensis DSM 18889]
MAEVITFAYYAFVLRGFFCKTTGMLPPHKPSPPAWFAAKRFGYGAGLPIAWQGWVALGLFLAVTLGSTFGLSVLPLRRPLLAVGVVMVLNLAATVAFFWVCKIRTKGGWKWRWGTRD